MEAHQWEYICRDIRTRWTPPAAKLGRPVCPVSAPGSQSTQLLAPEHSIPGGRSPTPAAGAGLSNTFPGQPPSAAWCSVPLPQIPTTSPVSPPNALYLQPTACPPAAPSRQGDLQAGGGGFRWALVGLRWASGGASGAAGCFRETWCLAPKAGELSRCHLPPCPGCSPPLLLIPQISLQVALHFLLRGVGSSSSILPL